MTLPETPPNAEEETEVIDTDDLNAVPHLTDVKGGRQWMLALALLLVILIFGSTLLGGVLGGLITENGAASLAGTLIAPLGALLGTAVVFFYRD